MERKPGDHGQVIAHFIQEFVQVCRKRWRSETLCESDTDGRSTYLAAVIGKVKSWYGSGNYSRRNCSTPALWRSAARAQYTKISEISYCPKKETLVVSSFMPSPRTP